MSKRHEYPAGVPCWVETLQPDPERAQAFYGGLFGWEFESSGGADPYFVARLDGHDVAGLRSLPPGGPPGAIWNTNVRVATVDQAVQDAVAAGGTVLLGPVDAAPAGRFAVLADPTGAAFSVWEAGTREGAQLVNEPGAWMMSALHTPDQDAAAAFYGSVFGWEAAPIAPGAPVQALRRPGYVGGEPDQGMSRDVAAVMAGTESPPGTPPIPPHWSVNFCVAEVDATLARAAELGGTLLMAPVNQLGLRSAAVMDPQGAVIAISQTLPLADSA